MDLSPGPAAGQAERPERPAFSAAAAWAPTATDGRGACAITAAHAPLQGGSAPAADPGVLESKLQISLKALAAVGTAGAHAASTLAIALGPAPAVPQQQPQPGLPGASAGAGADAFPPSLGLGSTASVATTTPSTPSPTASVASFSSASTGGGPPAPSAAAMGAAPAMPRDSAPAPYAHGPPDATGGRMGVKGGLGLTSPAASPALAGRSQQRGGPRSSGGSPAEG